MPIPLVGLVGIVLATLAFFGIVAVSVTVERFARGAQQGWEDTQSAVERIGKSLGGVMGTATKGIPLPVIVGGGLLVLYFALRGR